MTQHYHAVYAHFFSEYGTGYSPSTAVFPLSAAQGMVEIQFYLRHRKLSYSFCIFSNLLIFLKEGE